MAMTPFTATEFPTSHFPSYQTFPLLSGKLRHLAFDECATLYEIFLRGRRVSDDGPCLGWRPANGEPYSWLSYSQVTVV